MDDEVLSRHGNQKYTLDQIERRYPVSDGAEHSVSIGREDNIALSIHSPTEVRELEVN